MSFAQDHSRGLNIFYWIIKEIHCCKIFQNDFMLLTSEIVHRLRAASLISPRFSYCYIPNLCPHCMQESTLTNQTNILINMFRRRIVKRQPVMPPVASRLALQQLLVFSAWVYFMTLLWRHDERDGFSNHQRFDCLINRLFRRRLKKTSKPRATGLCEGNQPMAGGFTSQRANNTENVSIWWRHNDDYCRLQHINSRLLC